MKRNQLINLPIGMGGKILFPNNGEIQLLNKSVAVIYMAGLGHIEIVCGLGRTPKTYHSGDRVIGKINIITPENVMTVAREFSGNSNAEAEALALQECHMVLPAKGATALGIQFCKSFVHEHEGLGKISSWKKIQEDILNNAQFSLREAGVEEYLQVLQGTQMRPNIDTAVAFHSWKSESLLEKGWTLHLLNTVAGLPCSILFASNVGADKNPLLIAEEVVVAHLKEVGYEEYFSPEESGGNETRRRSKGGGETGRARTPQV